MKTPNSTNENKSAFGGVGTYSTKHETNVFVGASELPHGGSKETKKIQRRSLEDLHATFDAQEEAKRQ